MKLLLNKKNVISEICILRVFQGLIPCIKSNADFVKKFYTFCTLQLISAAFEHNALDLVFFYMDLKKNADVRLAFEAIKVLYN